MAEKLFTEFPPVSTEKWEEVIQKDLKGADYEKKLVWKTMEGFSVRPYYRAEDLKNLKFLAYAPDQFPYVRGNSTQNAWKVRQNFCGENAAEANKLALDALMKGVDSVGFYINGKEGISEADFNALTKDINPEAAEINFIGGCCKSAEFVTLMDKKVKAAKVNPENVWGSIDYDPLRHMTTKGSFCNGIDKDFELLRGAVVAANELPNFRTIGVSGYIFHNAGSSIVQELAFALAMGNEYMSRLTDAGLNPDQVAKSIKFTFAVSSNYFMEIAKFRAARMLWASVTSAYGVTTTCGEKMCAHAVTSQWNQTVYDPYVNMLRGTTEAMSAALSGVCSIEVSPFDKPFRKAGEFSNRIARNTQILLKEESHFDKVIDPAAGSYYIESLTSSIAEEAWKLFKQVEEKGGYVAAFKAGFIQEQVAKMAASRDSNIATRREILLGTNQYPNFTEKLDAEVRANVAKGCCCCCGGDKGEKIAEPIKTYRAGQAFEELRMKTENCGKTPKAFMLTFGSLAMCRARAQFSSNFFACAGFETIDNNRFATVEEGVKAAMAAGASLVIACASDDDYAEAVPQIAAQVGNKAIVVVAGDPACKADLEAKGIKHFISARSNVLETLKQYQSELGI